MTNKRIALIINLYQSMPGAPKPPEDERGRLWGEVENTEHWEFCEAVVDAMIQVAQAYAK